MYILLCANAKYYVGSTKYLDRRVEQHQSGKGANFTRKHLPVKLIYYEEFDKVDDAFNREKQIQHWSHAKKKALIEGKLKDLKILGKKYFG